MSTENVSTQIMQRQEELARLRAIPSNRVNGHFERMLADIYAQAEELREMLRPTIHNHMEPIVVPPAEVRVAMPDTSDAIAAMSEMMAALVGALLEKETVVNVNVEAVPVEVTLVESERAGTKTVSFKRDPNGRIVSATVTEE